MDETRPTPPAPDEPGGVATQPPPPPPPVAEPTPPPSGGWQPSPAPERPGRSGPSVVLATLLIAIGVLALLATFDVAIRWDLVLPSALVVLGAGLLLGARQGGHGGLIVLGVFLTLFASAAVAVDGTVSFTVGDRTFRPAAATAVADSYGLGIGNLTVDLRDVAFDRATVPLDVHVTLGDLVLRVPDDVRVQVHAHATAGDIRVFDRSQDGLGPDIDAVFGPASASTTLDVDATVVFGSVEVRP